MTREEYKALRQLYRDMDRTTRESWWVIALVICAALSPLVVLAVIIAAVMHG